MSSRPRLLMLLHAYYPDDTRVAAQARAAVAAGFDVDVVALGRPGDTRRDEIDGVRCLRIPIQHSRGAGMAALVREYLGFIARSGALATRLSLRHRYDVVEVHNPPDFLVLAALVPRALGAGTVLDIHDLSSDMFAMRFEGRRGARAADHVLRAVERWACRTSSAVLTVHEPYRRELAARGVPAEKIAVVMNSLDEALLPPQRPEKKDGTFRIVYHGSVTPNYGVELIVEAAAAIRERVPHVRVEIYGEGDAVPELKARAGELGFSDALYVSPTYLSIRDVLRAVQGASVGVIPNRPNRLNRFALSTKLFDYVALDIPVVSANLPTIEDHFSGDEVLYFDAGSATSLADALLQIAMDPAAAVKRAAAARRRYERYRWERSAHVYVDVLRRTALLRRSSPVEDEGRMSKPPRPVVDVAQGLRQAETMSIAWDIAKNVSLALPPVRRVYANRRLRVGRTVMSHSADYPMSVFEMHRQAITRLRPIAGDVLEIGPGGSVAVAALFVKHGASSAVCIDSEPWLSENQSVQHELELDDSILERVRYEPGHPIEQARFEGESFDIIFSHAVLEHILDPAAGIRQIGRMLRAGGVTTHLIDMRDHRNFEDPLRFLRHRERTWRLATSRRPASPNRWRTSQYAQAFEAAGLDVVSVVRDSTSRVTELERRSFAHPFCDLSLDDLETTSVLLTALKRS